MFDDGLGDEELMTVQGLDGYGDYGALYQAPDGSVYQMQGLGAAAGGSGAGFAGEIRQGADGQLYQWVEGYNGLGEPVGFWSIIPAIAQAALPLISKVIPQLFRAGGGGGAGQILQRILPQASQLLRQVLPIPPAPAPVAPAAASSDELTGFGALYQAPDGSLYQVQGFADEERLADEELIRGLDEDERYGEDEMVRGLDQDERYGEDETLREADGYVRENDVRGVDAYVKPQPPHTRPFVRPAQPPEMWRPLW